MTETSPDPAAASDREIVIRRLIDAPREFAFDAWTDPAHVAQWWGPNGFTTIHEMAVRPEGVWRFIMHGLDGVDYPNKIVFIEVVKPERLVYTHGGDEGGVPVKFHVTVTFDDQSGKTQITMRSLFETAAERDWIERDYGAIEGGIQHLSRLAEHLVKR